jgi:hypothetical protein
MNWRVLVLILLALALLLGRSKGPTKPPDHGLGKREWFREPCYSRTDGMVYFRYVGEGSHPPGIYRFALADPPRRTASPAGGGPEFLELDGEQPTISPCGTTCYRGLSVNLHSKRQAIPVHRHGLRQPTFAGMRCAHSDGTESLTFERA